MSGAIINLILSILSLYTILIFAMVILSWLKVFGIANMKNPIVAQISHVIDALTEPVLRPIRNILPNMSGLDISPLVLLLGIFFLQNLLTNFARGQFL